MHPADDPVRLHRRAAKDRDTYVPFFDYKMELFSFFFDLGTLLSRLSPPVSLFLSLPSDASHSPGTSTTNTKAMIDVRQRP